VFATPTFDAVHALRWFGLCAALVAVPPNSTWAADSGHDDDFFTMERPPDPGEGRVQPDIIPFWTTDLKTAVRAYRRGDFEKAAELFSAISEDGNIVADWYLGHLYQLGRGVGRDDAKAFSYYSRVADAFDPNEPRDTRLRIMIDAIVKVAQYYATGVKPVGIPRNPDRATSLFKLAASYGHPGAQYALGVMAIDGERQRPVHGLQWLRAAAKKRFAPAEAKLGDLYWEGAIVKQDRTRALMWYILAQETAHPDRDRRIIDRFANLMDQASEEERLEAAARAKVWADRYPIPKPPALGE
jgi:hypothetical protein